MDLSNLDARQSGRRGAWRLARRAIVIRGTVAISAFALTLSGADRWSRTTPPVDSSPPVFRVDGSSIVLDETAPEWRVLRLGVATPAKDDWTDPFPARFEIDETRALKWVVADVPEAKASQVIEGMEAEAANASIPGRHWKGRVQMVSSAENPGGHAVSIRVIVSKSGRRLRPNIPVQVRFRIAHRSEAAEVPASSLVTDGERQYVYVLTGPDRLTRRAVATGSPERDRVPILSGLGAGETIVEEGALLLENEMALHHDASEQPAGGEE